MIALFVCLFSFDSCITLVFFSYSIYDRTYIFHSITPKYAIIIHLNYILIANAPQNEYVIRMESSDTAAHVIIIVFPANARVYQCRFYYARAVNKHAFKCRIAMFWDFPSVILYIFAKTISDISSMRFHK